MHSDPLTLQKVFSQQVSGLNEAWRGHRSPTLAEVKQRKEEVVLVRKPGPGISPAHSETLCQGWASLGFGFPQPRGGSQDSPGFLIDRSSLSKIPTLPAPGQQTPSACSDRGCPHCWGSGTPGIQQHWSRVFIY